MTDSKKAVYITTNKDDDVCDYLYNNWKGDDHYITDIIEGLRNNMKK